MKKKGSATLVVILLSTIFMLYSVSTYSDVRHMKRTYDEYYKRITSLYEQEYNKMVDIL